MRVSLFLEFVLSCTKVPISTGFFENDDSFFDELNIVISLKKIGSFTKKIMIKPKSIANIIIPKNRFFCIISKRSVMQRAQYFGKVSF